MDFWGKIGLFCSLLGHLALFSHGVMARPRIVATIPPLGFIASAISGDLADVEVLLPGDTSPHVQSLTPRHQRTLKKADLIFWVGPGYEGFLSKIMTDPDFPPQKILTAAKISLPFLYPSRSSECSAHSHPDHPHDHDGNDLDHHVWLDPRNGATLADGVCAMLENIDPTSAPLYRANRDVFRLKMADLHQKLTKILAPLAHKPFYVFHDGYQYMEKGYGLSGLGPLTPSPHIPFSLKRLRTLRKIIHDRAVFALFGEKQFDGTAVSDLARSLDLRFGILDPFGGDMRVHSDSYARLLTRLAQSFQQTLTTVH